MGLDQSLSILIYIYTDTSRTRMFYQEINTMSYYIVYKIQHSKFFYSLWWPLVFTLLCSSSSPRQGDSRRMFFLAVPTVAAPLQG